MISLPKQIPDENNVYHLFPVLCEKRDELQEYLKQNGVQTLIHYPIPPHQQECYAQESWNIPQLSLPITDRIHNQELSLPMGQCLTQEQVEYVVKCINEFK